MSSPLSNLPDGLWLSRQFYDGTKTQERGESRGCLATGLFFEAEGKQATRSV